MAPRLKRTLHFGFLLMGFSATVTQALLIRELLVAFFGNELSIGLTLANWLVLEAAGSGLLGRLSGRWGRAPVSFAALQVLFALFLPLCLYAAYLSRSIAGAIPGEGVGLNAISWTSFLVLSPLALVAGAMFAFGSRVYAQLRGDQAPSIGRVYVYEAWGAVLGGIVFTYLLIPFLNSVHVALSLSSLNLLSAALILAAASPSASRKLAVAPGFTVVLALLVANIVLLISPVAQQLQRWMTVRQWAGQNLVYSENSVYGNVAVVRRDSQHTFYADGIPVLTTPVPDLILTEDIVHLPLLFVPQPRRVLVLSGAVGGVLQELAKYPLQQIDYAELDPLLIEAVMKFPSPLTASELNDPRVRIEQVDGRLFVRNRVLDPTTSQGGYDLVIINLPYPSTLQLNRFYTVEFFQMVGKLLSEQGIVVVACPASLTYMSHALRDLNRMIALTLQQVFPYVRPIPGEPALWLASASDEISKATTWALVDRWEGREVETKLVTDPYVRHRLDPRYLEWFQSSLVDQSTDRSPVNRDFHPLGLFYGLSYWNALFSPQVAQLLAPAGRLNLWAVGIPILATTLLLMVVIKRTGRGRAAVVPSVVMATGFTGMTAHIVMIFAFQTLHGYVYQWIGLLIAAFMGGLSLGGLLMTRRLASITREKSTLIRLELALIVFWALLPVVLGVFDSETGVPLVTGSMPGLSLLLNAVAGLLVGLQFPLANRIWLRGTRGGGVLYAWDLLGAFAGAILVSVVLIPVLGIPDTCLTAAMLKFASFLLVVTLLRR